MTLLRLSVAAILAAALPAAPALAHHSYSAFDRSEAAKRHIAGTVRDFALINPHGWLKLVVAEPDGRTASWTFELSSATQLQPLGWSPASIRVGDKVDVTFFPLRFGSYGGQLVAVRLPAGKVLQGTAEPDRGYPKPAGANGK
ncbi:MAG TPA: DUF6152 family protein [Novosphingobium sp.]|nr:DUF6152 family protein [Novosphingobium sp.]